MDNLFSCLLWFRNKRTELTCLHNLSNDIEFTLYKIKLLKQPEININENNNFYYNYHKSATYLFTDLTLAIIDEKHKTSIEFQNSIKQEQNVPIENNTFYNKQINSNNKEHTFT